MRYLAALLTMDKDIAKGFDDKIIDRQKDGLSLKEIETTIENKTVKIWLPNDVRDQYKAVLLAESFLLREYLEDSEIVFKLRMDILNVVLKHCLIDGEKLTLDMLQVLDFEFIDLLITYYVTELLLPLHQRSSAKVKTFLKKNLSQYISK